MPNSNSVVHFFLVDFGWWVTILGKVGDHLGDGGWPGHLLCGIVHQSIGSQYTKSWPPIRLRTRQKVCGGVRWVCKPILVLSFWAKTLTELAEWPKLNKSVLFLNRPEFRQKLIGYVMSELCRQNAYRSTDP